MGQFEPKGTTQLNKHSLFRKARVLVATTCGILAIAVSSLVAAAAENAAAPQSEKDCLATAIYFEARGESARGQRAVAEVIVTRARTRGWPQTICGVVYDGSRGKRGCQFSFACDRASNHARDRAAWARAQHVAGEVLSARGKTRSIACGATYFHHARVRPRWAARMVKVAQIGSQVFYRP